MRRRVTDSDDCFDLLPYIAILMCLLGTLLLITMSMASIYVGPAAGVVWVPDFSGREHSKVPTLVEWDGETATVHLETQRKVILLGKEVRRWWRTDGSFRNREMAEFVNEMARRSASEYVLFAVRPSGFATFQLLAREFRARKVGLGYEPIEQQKTIRLRVPRESKP